jgi:protein TonB
MIALTVQDRCDLNRWLICGTVVLFAHAGIAAALIEWRAPLDEGRSGTDAIMLELEPMQVPLDIRTDLPPGPEQVQADPTPDKPVEKVEDKAEPLPEQKSEVMLAPTPEPQSQPVPHEDNPPAPATSAPQPNRARTGVPAWKSEIVAILERNKRYPPQARARRERGVTQLAFSIDRQGHVLSSRIVASSGSAALDEETLALVQRAQPFPVPPAELAGEEISFTVPVRYNFR